MEITFYYISSDRGGFFLWKKTKLKFITEVVSTIQDFKKKLFILPDPSLFVIFIQDESTK